MSRTDIVRAVSGIALPETAGLAGAGADEVGAAEVGAVLLDVPAIDVLGEAAADDAGGADVDVPACLELELHAAASVAIATRAPARR